MHLMQRAHKVVFKMFLHTCAIYLLFSDWSRCLSEG